MAESYRYNTLGLMKKKRKATNWILENYEEKLLKIKNNKKKNKCKKTEGFHIFVINFNLIWI